jgi:hypothetical protein
MIQYKIRNSGLTHEQNFAGSESLLRAFSKWKPEEGMKIDAFVSNVSGAGGFVLAEADDPKIIASFISKYNFWNDVEVTPVIDVGDAVAIAQAALSLARSSSKA